MLTRLYCQSCDESFVDIPTNAFPHHCPGCGGRQWATWKRGEIPLSALSGSHMIPILNANACAPCPTFMTISNQPGLATYRFGDPTTHGTR